jgi:hypothetical protein
LGGGDLLVKAQKTVEHTREKNSSGEDRFIYPKAV